MKIERCFFYLSSILVFFPGCLLVVAWLIEYAFARAWIDDGNPAPFTRRRLFDCRRGRHTSHTPGANWRLVRRHTSHVVWIVSIRILEQKEWYTVWVRQRSNFDIILKLELVPAKMRVNWPSNGFFRPKTHRVCEDFGRPDRHGIISMTHAFPKTLNQAFF